MLHDITYHWGDPGTSEFFSAVTSDLTQKGLCSSRTQNNTSRCLHNHSPGRHSPQEVIHFPPEVHFFAVVNPSVFQPAAMILERVSKGGMGA